MGVWDCSLLSPSSLNPLQGTTGWAVAAVLLPATVSFFIYIFFWTESHPVAQIVLELCVAHAGLELSTFLLEAS